MQDGQAPQPKQLLSERIKNATNILVTVSRDPSVDELSAALALTLMLNKLGKHATAVFSGKTPSAIEFLNPEKTFEGTVDSLRDFIIALDKEKADRLRYKVEDDVVRIFITPYRTVINEKDLAFSQGDFNVELIIALGVEKKEDLDAAVTAHGRILHDATVATINIANQGRSLGSIDWTDAGAGSFSEMLMSLSESLKSGILDEQIATALLTGIVAATERFANTKTTPKVMTMAAQLMAAGANQQLIATKLKEGNELPADKPSPDGSTRLKESRSKKVAQVEASEDAAPVKKSDGEMQIEHEAASDAETATQKAGELADEAEMSKSSDSRQSQSKTLPSSDSSAVTQPDNSEDTDATKSSEPAVEVIEAPVLPKLPPTAPTLSVEDLKKDLASANEELEKAAAEPLKNEKNADGGSPQTDSPFSQHESSWRDTPEDPDEPTFGGTLNATTDEAHDAKEREERKSRNHTLLSHDDSSAPVHADASPLARDNEPASVDPFAEPPKSEPDSPMHYEATEDTHGHGPTIQPLHVSATDTTANSSNASALPTLAELEAQAHTAASTPPSNPINDARAAVNAALESLPFNPASEPLAASGAQPLSATSLHDTSAPAIAPVVSQSAPIASTAPATSSLPPLPDFSTLPPLPPEPGALAQTAPMASAPSSLPPFDLPTQQPVSSTPAPVTVPSSNDPGQFKLPGQ